MISSGMISSGSSFGKDSEKNSNLSRLFLFLDVPVDPRLVSVVEYPRFMEENFEKYCVLHPLIMKKVLNSLLY